MSTKSYYATHKQIWKDCYAKSKERILAKDKRDSIKSRIGAIIVLGGKCAQCGYCENLSALQIDHIVPLNNTDRGIRNRKKYEVIIRGERDNLQLLCSNCHAIKHWPI